MKSFSLIWCFYVCLLLTIPCQDNGVHSGVAGHFASESAGHHHHDENECHHCSPFCTCNCCHVSVVTSLFVVPGVHIDRITPVLLMPKEQTSEGIAYTVWQPPKSC